MTTLIRELIRPYRGTLLIVLLAMLVETAMSLAAPWPLKMIIDNVIGGRRLPHELERMIGPLRGHNDGLRVAALAAATFVLIALLGAVASYVDNYFTESLGQWVAHDLRLRTYHHLKRLSLGYYDTHQTSALLSTITPDIQTIQGFASSSTLDILIDILTIFSMLGLMFWLNWDFTLIALAVTPVLLFLTFRFKKAVKKATHQVRNEQAEIVEVVQQGLQSIQVIKAFGRQDLEQETLRQVSQATVSAALAARKIKSLLSPIVTVAVALCTAIVLWRGAALVLAGTMTVGALTVYLSYLTKFFKPVKDLATTTNAIAQAAVGVDRVREILETDDIISERADAIEPRDVKGEIIFDRVAFAYLENSPVLSDVSFHIKPGQLVGIVGPTGSGKSTIVSLIPRFYDVVSGRILVDGRDVRDYKIHPW